MRPDLGKTAPDADCPYKVRVIYHASSIKVSSKVTVNLETELFISAAFIK